MPPHTARARSAAEDENRLRVAAPPWRLYRGESGPPRRGGPGLGQTAGIWRGGERILPDCPKPPAESGRSRGKELSRVPGQDQRNKGSPTTQTSAAHIRRGPAS